MKNRGLDATVLTAAVLGSLLFVNVFAWNFSGCSRRVDLTRDQMFTLSPATRVMLQRIEDPVTIRAYFSAELPSQLASVSRYTRDILDEFYNESGGTVRYEFIDPIAEETDADKEKKKEVKTDVFGRRIREQTSIEQELQGIGIQPLQVTVNESDKVEQRRVYMGISLKYGGETEVIPVVQDTQTLEYELTRLIKKLTRTSVPKLAVLTGFGTPTQQEGLAGLHEAVGIDYEVTTLDLTTETTIPEDITALIVVAPKEQLSDQALRAIDAFVASGRSAAFFLDPYNIDMTNGQVSPLQTGLDPLLASYGVGFESGMVLDPQCAQVSVPRPNFPIPQRVQFPYWPAPQALNEDNPLTRGLSGIVFPFTGGLTLNVGEESGVEATALVESSEESWVVQNPTMIDPTRRWTKADVGEQNSHILLATLQGAVAPHFAQGPEAVAGGDARIIVAAQGGFVQDQFLGQSRSNQAFLLNLVDWLMVDEALLEVRSRGLSVAPLDEISDGSRTAIKYANILGVPFLFVLYGLGRWRMRESRRDRAGF